LGSAYRLLLNKTIFRSARPKAQNAKNAYKRKGAKRTNKQKLNETNEERALGSRISDLEPQTAALGIEKLNEPGFDKLTQQLSRAGDAQHL
jgi:hypothetical protein